MTIKTAKAAKFYASGLGGLDAGQIDSFLRMPHPRRWVRRIVTHPFLSLIVEALNLTHPRFALANGREYAPGETAEPPAARKVRERSFLMEFYHEFRRLWDQAVPVQRGLGHIIVQADPEAGSRTPDLLFWQLGERDQPDQRLGAVSIAFASNPDAVAADQTLLARFRATRGYPHAVSVVVGSRAEVPERGSTAIDGVTVIGFDIATWRAMV